MSFERPVFLLALLALPLLGLLFRLVQRRRMRYSMHFTNLAVLREVAGGRSWRRAVPPALFGLALAALVVAVARPQVRGLVPQDRATIVLVLDVSRSMEARDVRPSRLVAAKQSIRAFLDRVPERLRIGLVVFAGIPQVASPPTHEHAQVSATLDSLDDYATFGGTAIGDAIATAVELGQETLQRDAADPESPAEAPREGERSLVSILFLSDGAQRGGYLQPLEGADLAKEARMPVYTIALGTANGTVPGFGGGSGFGAPFDTGRIPVPPDPVTLKAIADATGGEFTFARDAEALGAAYEELGQNLGRRESDKEMTYVALMSAAGLLLGAGLLSSLWSARLP
jgi:Ca-activated chloride channel family protein